MIFSKYFNLNKAEATDKFNELTINNPAVDKIDEQMYKNQNAAVQPAEHSKSGTVHALVKSINTASVIRFTATADFTVGDTFTLDGQPISGKLPDGSALQTNAFRTGNNVLCIHAGGLLTLMAVNTVAATATKLETARLIGKAMFDGSKNITLEQMGILDAMEYVIASNAPNVNTIEFAMTIGKVTGLRYRMGFEISQTYTAGSIVKLGELATQPTNNHMFAGIMSQYGTIQVPCIIYTSGKGIYACCGTTFTYTPGATYPVAVRAYNKE